MTAQNSEIAMGLAFLDSTLGASSALQADGVSFYRGLAPAGTPQTAPYGIISLMSAPDSNTANGIRIMAEPLFLVKVVGPASLTPTLRTIYQHIDQALMPGGRPQLVTNADGYILAISREQSIQYDELAAGVLITHLGGQYRLAVQSA